VSEEPQPGSIVFSGGHVEIGALAQGPHARATSKVIRSPDAQTNGGQSENLASLIRELMAALRQHSNDLPDHETAQAAAHQISAELDQEHPDKSRIRQLLTRVATAAGPVTAIAAAVAAVEQAISGMLSATGSNISTRPHQSVW
jgi:hypothetical protein